MPRRVKVGYGVADLGLEAVEILIQLYLLKFYNLVVGVPSELAGLALGLGMVWDAVSDPLMGTISDHSRFNSGRRRPYMLPGAALVAVAFIAIFNPPVYLSQWGGAAYLLVSVLALNTGLTIISVPYIALGADLSFDRDVRTELFGSRRAFGTIGLMLGMLLPALFLTRLTGDPIAAERASRSLASFTLAGPILLSAYVTFRVTRGRDDARVAVPLRGLIRVMGTTFRDVAWAVGRNNVFRPLAIAFIVASAARTINASIALYFYEFRIGIPEQTTVLAVLLPFFVFFLVSIPGWIRISRRFGKRVPAIWGVVLLGLVTAIWYPLMSPESLTGPMGIALVGGLLAGSIILFDSLVADVVDYDELMCGQRREGLYFGVWRLAMKVSRALGLVASGLLLATIGFDPAEGPPHPEATGGLALLFGPVVGGLFVLAGVLFILFPLTDARHRRVQALLVRKRANRR